MPRFGLFRINRRCYRWVRCNQLNGVQQSSRVGRRTRGPHRWCNKPPASGSQAMPPLKPKMQRSMRKSKVLQGMSGMVGSDAPRLSEHRDTSRGSKGTCRCASNAEVSLRCTGTKVPVDCSLGAAIFLRISGTSCTPTERNHERSRT
jgi:hypothetical protein